jgi:Flp pilus assembly protein TadG
MRPAEQPFVAVYERRGQRRISRRHRRGLATGWLLIAGPVFIVMLYVVLEIGNIWLHKQELETALEAAALAAARQWASSDDTGQARTYAYQYALANGVTLDRNENTAATGDANDNDDANCGDIILGDIDGDGCGVYTLDPSEQPSGGFPANIHVGFTVRIETTIDTRTDISSTNRYDFEIKDFTATQGVADYDNIRIKSVRFDVSTVPDSPSGSLPGTGFFDLRIKATGQSNDKNYGLPPGFDGLGTDPWGPTSGSGVSDSLAGGDFSYVPPAGSATSSTFQVNFDTGATNPFEPNKTPSDAFVFGVDTDDVGVDDAPGGEEVDWGGDFDGTTVTIAFEDTGGGIASITGTMARIDPTVSEWTFSGGPLTGGGDYGVLAQNCWQVTPICSQLLGLPVGPYYVWAQAAATSEKTGTPRLIRVQNTSGNPFCPCSDMNFPCPCDCN